MKKYNKLFIPFLYIGVIGVMVMCVLVVISGIKSFVIEKPNLTYVIDDVFSDISPVVKTESNTIIRPYLSDKVRVGKYFYDYESDEKKQESALIYFKNTYMQNNGVDYVSEEDFDVVSILDGEVESIETSEVYGKVITIKNNENLKTIYANIEDVTITVGYKVAQGEIIGKSTPSKINNDNLSTLHFEVLFKNEKIDPENLYTLSVSELE